MRATRRQKPRTVSEQLREAVSRSGMTVYELAQAAGVDRSVLSRFISGQRTITLATVDRLATVLHLRLEPR